ncbi:ribonuclease E inhibitor RraB [Balneolales bacterium ANBcel1]|nr:ribonuclease E inhibitor RraB [Balneolales bacterium ANBcel1]
MGKINSESESARLSGYVKAKSVGVERPIVFYIEINDESSAYYMAARLQKEHWEVNVIPTGSCWICLAHAVATPDHQTISDLCDYLSDLSEFYGGTFKRWELDSPY